MSQKKYSLRYLAEFLGSEFIGNPDCEIAGIGSLASAISGHISFLQDSNYKQYLNTTKASAIIINCKDLEQNQSGNFIIADDPYLAYAKISALFDDTPEVILGTHATAVIGEGSEIASGVSIGPYCIIGRRVIIAQGARIDGACVIGDDVGIGENTRLCSNVTLYHKVKIGKRGLLHSGAVIGSDGFGNANEKGVWRKIYQLGTVIIGNDVEIGANTTIDRGAIEDTIIDDGVRIDNQVQIGHNVHVGAHTAIAGCVGIAGSTKIGRYCMIAGGVGITGHIEIADRVIITGGSNLGKSITESGGIYASGIPAMPHRTWWRILARLINLEDLMRRVKVLERKQL